MQLKIELDEEQAGPMQLEALVLQHANLSISGVVVDDEEKPVVAARVSVRGDRQPYRNTVTDKDGKFVLEQVVADEFRISANANTSEGRQHGAVMAKGGDKEVMIVLGQYAGSRPRLPKPRSVLGKPLGSLEQFGIDLPAEGIKAKMILICFWDMDQRPARRCIRMLAAKDEELKKRGVVVLSVHASGADEKRLREWTTKNKIPFTAGCAPAAGKTQKKTLSAWGVRAVPWLILTDRKHVVRAEGFGLIELDEKLKEVSE